MRTMSGRSRVQARLFKAFWTSSLWASVGDLRSSIRKVAAVSAARSNHMRCVRYPFISIRLRFPCVKKNRRVLIPQRRSRLPRGISEIKNRNLRIKSKAVLTLLLVNFSCRGRSEVVKSENPGPDNFPFKGVFKLNFPKGKVRKTTSLFKKKTGAYKTNERLTKTPRRRHSSSCLLLFWILHRKGRNGGS